MKFSVSNKNKNKTGVYKITNLINNKFYIGSTSNSFYNRFHQHLSDFKIGKREIRILYRAFEKYGVENFSFKIVHIALKEECISAEQFYLDKGTDYNCAKIAGSVLGLKHRKDSKTRTVIKGEHHCAIAVDMYSKDEKFIKSFDSITEAIEETGIKSKSNITQCCKGKVFSAGGYRWSLKGKSLVKRVKRQYGTTQIAIIKNNFYKEFHSQKNAKKYFISIGYIKCTQGMISNAIRNNNKVYNFKIIKI